MRWGLGIWDWGFGTGVRRGIRVKRAAEWQSGERPKKLRRLSITSIVHLVHNVHLVHSGCPIHWDSMDVMDVPLLFLFVFGAVNRTLLRVLFLRLA